jgi:catechol 2,3-dioxygenase-like lactoylglutathione lyase family enzyme
MPIIGIDHIQLAMPPDCEDEARGFYASLLGLAESPKPPALAARGGAWFGNDHVSIHVGVDPDFRATRKAHPGLLVTGLDELTARLRAAGHVVEDGEPLEGARRAYVDDPFGNRLELLERT